MMAYIRFDAAGVAHYVSSTGRGLRFSHGWCGRATTLTDKPWPFATCLMCLRMFDMTLGFSSP